MTRLGVQAKDAPHMEDQRFFGGKVAKWMIDPTCARYALKSLLKYFHDKKTGTRHTTVTVGHKYSNLPQFGANDTWTKCFFSGVEYATGAAQYMLSKWIGWDAYDNFPDASELLEKVDRPNDIGAWGELLERVGPVIVAGQPIGAASAVGHAILIIAVDDVQQTFIYLDALVGDKEQEAPFAMNEHIWSPVIHAQHNISDKLR